MPSQAEAQSRRVAEAARETHWKRASFLRDLFFGSFRLELVDPYPGGQPWRPEFRAFYEELKAFLVSKVHPAAIDAAGEYPREVLEGLATLGAFGLKIPVEYGGLGLTLAEY
jgi:alkylation response protein AidB-like acyl-CoA dehydrogenase